MSMASNFQMVFYRDDAGEILVKMLYNEHETAIRGLAPHVGPYYKWVELRDYLLPLS